MLIKSISKDIPELDVLSNSMKRIAKRGTWDGRELDAYFMSCRWWVPDLGMRAVFTRDVGYHTSGKNPDYERCLHLSLSFLDMESGEYKPREKLLTGLMLEAIFGKDKTKLWCEPPISEDGKKLDIWHYRLFCDERWQPIIPRGEVYNRELTEAGWKSYSDVQADLATGLATDHESGGF